MAKPNLALIPAAQGSKLFSVLPSSGVGDFDFTRDTIATRINSQGLIEEVDDGVSRLNYPMIDGKVVGCPHHILEPARTNKILYSQNFINTSWNNASVGTTPIVTTGFISPDGSTNAYKISNANQNSFWFQGGTTIGASDTRSIYARTVSGTGTAQLLSQHSNTNNTFLLTEEWQRFEVSSTTSSAGNTTFYAVDFRGSGTLSEILVWGAQVEVGSYPTSYIPTNGEANGVTRAAEVANGSGDADTFNDSEGVLMAEISALADSTSESVRRLSLSNGTNDNRIQILFSNVVGRIGVIVKSGGLFQIDTGFLGYNTTNSNKIAVRYGSGVFKVYINGLSVFNDAGVSFSSISLNNLRFSNPSGSEIMYSKTKQLQYYDSSLTDSELEQLTSWTSFTDMAQGQLYSVE